MFATTIIIELSVRNNEHFERKEPLMEVGNEIRKAAIDAGLTLAQVSEQSGMKRTRFSECVNGHKEFNANEL